LIKTNLCFGLSLTSWFYSLRNRQAKFPQIQGWSSFVRKSIKKASLLVHCASNNKQEKQNCGASGWP
jgi:hypothetical protein